MNEEHRALLRKFLEAECPDLEAAKKFCREWSAGTHNLSAGRQTILLAESGLVFDPSMRAAAALVSLTLEKQPYPDGSTDYLGTKYGPTLYREM